MMRFTFKIRLLSPSAMYRVPLLSTATLPVVPIGEPSAGIGCAGNEKSAPAMVVMMPWDQALTAVNAANSTTHLRLVARPNRVVRPPLCGLEQHNPNEASDSIPMKPFITGPRFPICLG